MTWRCPQRNAVKYCDLRFIPSCYTGLFLYNLHVENHLSIYLGVLYMRFFCSVEFCTWYLKWMAWYGSMVEVQKIPHLIISQSCEYGKGGWRLGPTDACKFLGAKYLQSSVSGQLWSLLMSKTNILQFSRTWCRNSSSDHHFSSWTCWFSPHFSGLCYFSVWRLARWRWKDASNPNSRPRVHRANWSIDLVELNCDFLQGSSQHPGTSGRSWVNIEVKWLKKTCGYHLPLPSGNQT